MILAFPVELVFVLNLKSTGHETGPEEVWVLIYILTLEPSRNLGKRRERGLHHWPEDHVVVAQGPVLRRAHA